MGCPCPASLSPAYPLKETREAVTAPGQEGGTVGGKEADGGVGVCPGQLQAGLHHSQQVGAAGWQRLLQPAVREEEESLLSPACSPKSGEGKTRVLSPPLRMPAPAETSFPPLPSPGSSSPVALQAVGVELGTCLLASRQETRRLQQPTSKGG